MKRNRLLVSAIALALSSTVYGMNETPSAGRYDSAVNYPEYRNSSSYALRASELIGGDVRNAADEVIGEIDDVVVSRDGGKVQAVVSVGGFLGIGSKLVLVPYEELRVTPDGKHVYFDATKDDLTQRAEFKYVNDGEIARDRGTESSENAIARAAADTTVADKAPKDADDSSRNVRDRDGTTLTPLDQSNDAADIDITRAIRKELMANESLSVDAENIKVITIGGKVTLRGPVESSTERARIVDLARQVAGADRVADELEVTSR